MHDAPAALWQPHTPAPVGMATPARRTRSKSPWSPTRPSYPALTRLICQLDLDLETAPRDAGARAEEPGAVRGVPARARSLLGLDGDGIKMREEKTGTGECSLARQHARVGLGRRTPARGDLPAGRLTGGNLLSPARDVDVMLVGIRKIKKNPVGVWGVATGSIYLVVFPFPLKRLAVGRNRCHFQADI